MIVSPTNSGVPLIAPSVNVLTEQTARDNRVREPVTPTVHLEKTLAEKEVKPDEKRRKQAAWDPSDHPEYDFDIDPDEEHSSDPQQHEAESELERLFKLLALATYSEEQGKGYVIRFRLPKHIIDAAIREGTMARRRTVIKYHYGHAISPNVPSEVLAVL